MDLELGTYDCFSICDNAGQPGYFIILTFSFWFQLNTTPNDILDSSLLFSFSS
jgi:hypothetical protein